MSAWRIITILLFVSFSIQVPLYTHGVSKKEVIVQEDIPRLEQEDSSFEELAMLNAFEVAKSTVFWQWIHRISGVMITRYTIIKRAMIKKSGQIKGWWHKRKPK